MMLNDYVAWWTEQMLSLVPPILRRKGLDDGDALVIEFLVSMGEPPSAVTLALRRHRRIHPLGSYPLDDMGLMAGRDAVGLVGRPTAIDLVLPPDMVMEKRVVLPLATEREIDRVITYEMDRETPFTADEVWWTAAVDSRDRAESKLTVRLSVVPRVLLAGLLDLLGQTGLRPTSLIAPTEDGTQRHIPLAGDGAVAAMFWQRRLLPLAIATCALLIPAVLATPFIRQAIALEEINDRISALKPQVTQVDALRRRIDPSGAGGDIFSVEMARLGDPLKVLAAVTKVLPDDTYLTEFTMRQRQVTLVGQSVDAAQLIGALAHDTSFRDPAFTAPITRLKDVSRDLFSIKVEARP
jgi:general secretion pathway protein L